MHRRPDEMLHKVTAAIEAGQHGQAVSYFRQAISLNIDRSEMFYWTSIDKSSEISSKLSNELALAYKKNRNYDKAFLFYKELSQKDPDNVDYLGGCCRNAGMSWTGEGCVAYVREYIEVGCG